MKRQGNRLPQVLTQQWVNRKPQPAILSWHCAAKNLSNLRNNPVTPCPVAHGPMALKID
jgi:hypothetical protein